MSKLYRIEVKIVGTAYVRATTKKQAREKLAANIGAIYADDWDGSEPEISSARFDAPDFPDISLSPAMTVQGLYRGTDEA